MNPILVFEQLLNGTGYGLMLFLIAAGLTLVFGIMDVMNLSHGSLFMVGAYVAAMLVGLVDTIGRAFLPLRLRATLPPALAADLGPLFAEVSMYALMAAVLAFPPAGLFSAKA